MNVARLQNREKRIVSPWSVLKYGFLNFNFFTTELETENFALQVYIPAFYFFKNIFNILIISNLKQSKDKKKALHL